MLGSLCAPSWSFPVCWAPVSWLSCAVLRGSLLSFALCCLEQEPPHSPGRLTTSYLVVVVWAFAKAFGYFGASEHVAHVCIGLSSGREKSGACRVRWFSSCLA